MASTSFFVVPFQFWQKSPSLDPGSVNALLLETISLRRRISKGANQDAERSRYSVCLSDLEMRREFSKSPQKVASLHEISKSATGNEIEAFHLPDAYFDLMALAHIERLERQSELEASDVGIVGTELGTSVIPPTHALAHAEEVLRFSNTLNAHPDLKKLAHERAEIFKTLAKANAGAVEIREELNNVDVPPPERIIRQDTPSIKVEDRIPTMISAKGRKKMADRLRLQIENALKSGEKVNFSDQPHEVNTEILAEFLHYEGSAAMNKVRVVYADGSEAKPFPLRSLVKPESITIPSASTQDGVIELKFALMSMRHLELDPFVDRAWYRNKEVSVTRPLAETDDYCFQYSMNELDELREVYAHEISAGTRLLLRMFHTGFEPAALGFYRAVVKELSARRNWFCVMPHYFRGGSRFETGKIVWE